MHIHLSQTQPTQIYLKALLVRDHRGFPLILQISAERWHNAAPTHQRQLCGNRGGLAWWKSCINSKWAEHKYQSRSRIIYCKGQIGQGAVSRNVFLFRIYSKGFSYKITAQFDQLESPHQQWHSALPLTRNNSLSYLIFILRKSACRCQGCRNVPPSPDKKWCSIFKNLLFIPGCSPLHTGAD